MKHSYFSVWFTVLLFSFFQHMSHARTIKNSVPEKTTEKTLEQAVVHEIESLLKEGKVPRVSFNEWVDTNTPLLLHSKKEALKNLGETLQAIRHGNTAKINAFNVLPQFEKAVQEYDKTFYISMLSKPGIIAKGTYWYFSSPKK